MAHLNERGQLILLMGFILATMFVALTIILNTAIYTENVATRSETAGGTEALTQREMVERGVGEIVRFVTEENRTDLSTGLSDSEEYERMEANVTQGVVELNESLQRHTALSLVIVNVSQPSNFEEGKKVSLESPPSDFQASSVNWTVVRDTKRTDGINGTRKFRIEVTDDTALMDEDVAATSQRFQVNVTSDLAVGDDYWRMDVTRDTLATEVIVTVKTDENPSGEECRRDLSALGDFWINVTAGTFAGRPCHALDFAEGIESDRYTVAFNNSDKIQGDYSLIVNTEGGSPEIPEEGNSGVTVTKAIYSTTVEYTYVAPELKYRTEILVAPGEAR